MPDERVSVVIDIDVKDQRQIALLQTQLLALGRQGNAAEKAMGGLSAKMGLSNTQMTTNSKGTKQLVRELTLLEKVGGKALKMARVVTFAVIGMALEFAVTALALASVNAAFAIGNAVMKAYKWGMQAVAGGLAAIGAAAIAAAAAFQEFQAAQYAFNYKDSKTLGTGLEQSSNAMRQMMTNATLASYGIKSLSSAYATASKNAKVDAKMIKQLEAMADFVSAGPNQDKQLQGAANFLSLIQRGKKANTDFAAELKAAAQEVGPAFSNMFKGNNVGDTGKLLQDLMSGKLAKKAGVAGQADTVAGTIFGKFKSMMTNMYVELGDVGRRLLAPLSDAMDRVFVGLRQSFRRLSGDFVAFGQGGVLPAMIKLSEKTEEFSINLFKKFLPAAAGWWKRTADAFKGFAAEFRDIRDALAPLREGGSAIIKTFALPLVQIFSSIGENVKHLSELGVKNKGVYKEFGERLQGIVKAFFNIGSATKEAFTVALPVINKVLDAISTIMNTVAKVLRLLSGLGSFGGAAGIGGMAYLAYKGRHANRQQRVKSGANRGKIVVNENEFVGSGLTAPYEEAIAAPRALDNALGVGGRITTPGAGPALIDQISTHSDNVKSVEVISDAYGDAKKTKSKVVDAAQKAADATKDVVSSKVSRMTVNADYVRVNNANKGGGGGPGDKLYGPQRPQRIPTPNAYEALAMQKIRDGERRVRDKRGKWQNFFNRRPAPPNPEHGDLIAGDVPKGRTLGSMNAIQKFKSFNRKLKELGIGAGGDPSGAIAQDGLGTAPGRILREVEKRARIKKETAAGKTIGGQFKRFGGFLGKIPGATKDRFMGRYKQARMAVPAYLKEKWYGGAKPDMPSISDAEGVSGKLSAIGARFGVGGQITGGTGTGPGGSFNTGLRARLGRAAFGQSFGTENFKFRNVLGGGNFAAGMDAEEARALKAGENASKGKQLKAGMRNSLSGVGALAGLGTDMVLNSKFGKKYMGDPDAQNSMRTGAALMAINPLLGAAVGFGGTAMNAKTVGGGAMAGALSGAAIGAMIGPVGAGIGAILGGVVGMAFAKKNQGKMAKKGIEAVANSKMFEIATASIEEALKTGTTKNARKELAGFTKFAKDFNAAGGKENRGKRQEMMKGYLDKGVINQTTYDLMTASHADDDARKQMKKTADDMNKALTPAFDQFDNIMKSLKLSTGMTSEEIVTLATKMNVDLYDPTIKLQDAIAKLGVGMVQTAVQINQSLRDLSIKSLGVFDKFKQTKAAKDALQAAGDKLRGGDTSNEAYMDYYTKATDFQNYTNPDDPIGNFLARNDRFKNGKLYMKGGLLNNVKQNAEFTGLMNDALTEEQAGAAKTLSTSIGQKLVKSGFNFEDAEGGSAMMEKQINALIDEAKGGDVTATRKLKALSSMEFGNDMNVNSRLLVNLIGGRATGAAERFTSTGRIIEGGAAVNGFQLGEDKTGAEKAGDLTDTQQAIRDGFLEAINSGLMSATSQPQWWDNSPRWWAQGLQIKNNKIVPVDDTSSPRAGAIGDTSVSKTLGRTMSRHNYFNGLVGGKRNVTSSWRDYGLGSPSSDHVTGNAYDLTGQNLGMYSSLINNSGGFAEFHGSAGSRHLHVVPPPSPMGDTSSGRMSSAGASSAPTTNEGDSFNITVVESKDAKSTAQEVARQIVEIQKTWRRRS